MISPQPPARYDYMTLARAKPDARLHQSFPVDKLSIEGGKKSGKRKIPIVGRNVRWVDG